MDTAGKLLIETIFPNLTRAGYRVTSPPSLVYNCLAWAAGDDKHWWEPISGPGYYWPDGAPLEYTIAALMKVYESLGYSPCNDFTLEAGYEKVALYANSDGYSHAARQLDNGQWTSKLGHLEDIVHVSFNALEGAEYGSVIHFMKRPVR